MCERERERETHRQTGRQRGRERGREGGREGERDLIQGSIIADESFAGSGSLVERVSQTSHLI